MVERQNNAIAFTLKNCAFKADHYPPFMPWFDYADISNKPAIGRMWQKYFTLLFLVNASFIHFSFLFLVFRWIYGNKQWHLTQSVSLLTSLSLSCSPSECFPSHTGGRLGLEETNQPRQPAAFLSSVCVYGQKGKDAAPCGQHQMHQAGSILTLIKDDNKK